MILECDILEQENGVVPNPASELGLPTLETSIVDQEVAASNDGIRGAGEPVFAADPSQFVPSPFIEPIPAMSQLEYEALKSDIQRCAQREPILVLGSEIIDGRARCQACRELAIPVWARQVQGSDTDMRALAESSNYHRRHLTKSQLAMIVAELTKDCKPGRVGGNALEAGAFTQKQTAARYGVSVALVQQAAKLLRENPEYAQRVRSGEWSLDMAEGRIRVEELNKDETVSAKVLASSFHYSQDQNRTVMTFKMTLVRIRQGLPYDQRDSFMVLVKPVCQFLGFSL